MNKTQIIKLLKQFFKIEELVHPDLLKIHSEETLWNTLDGRLLMALLWIRVEYGDWITINDDELKNCGLRYNQNSLSAHVLGKAFDLHGKNLEKLLEICKACPYLTEIEDPEITVPKGYLHISVREHQGSGIKIFKP